MVNSGASGASGGLSPRMVNSGASGASGASGGLSPRMVNSGASGGLLPTILIS
jgi:hypothetical protein